MSESMPTEHDIQFAQAIEAKPPAKPQQASAADLERTLRSALKVLRNNRATVCHRIDAAASAAEFAQNHPIMYIPRIGFHLYRSGVYRYIDNEYVLQMIADQLGPASKPSTRSAVMSELQIGHSTLIPEGESPNRNRRHVNLRNGIFNIDTGELMPHSPDCLSTIQLPLNYDPFAVCPRWLQFIDEIQPEPESRLILQEIAGLALIGDAPRYERCWWLYGSGGNGKGRYLNVIAKMIGDDNVSATRLQDLSKPFHAIRLYNKLINISTEVISGDVAETDIFKQVVSGDLIEDAFKHQNPIRFRPFCLLLFSLNELPTIYDTSDAFYNRIGILKFPVNFREDPRHDPYLDDKLLAELDGIFLWALDGLRRLEAQGRFTESPSNKLEIKKYRETNDKVLAFIQDCCEVGQYYSVGRAELFSAFREYCRANEYRSTSSKKFIGNVKRLLPDLEWEERMESNNGVYDRYVYGLGLRENIKPPEPDNDPDGF